MGEFVIRNVLPWFIETYSIRLNITVKNLRMARGRAEIIDINSEDVISGISAPKFRNGGAPIFVAMIRNHIIDMAGANIRIPLLIMRARELVIS